MRGERQPEITLLYGASYARARVRARQTTLVTFTKLRIYRCHFFSPGPLHHLLSPKSRASYNALINTACTSNAVVDAPDIGAFEVTAATAQVIPADSPTRIWQQSLPSALRIRLCHTHGPRPALRAGIDAWRGHFSVICIAAARRLPAPSSSACRQRYNVAARLIWEYSADVPCVAAIDILF